MTDRIIAYTVILEKEIREDDAEPITEAISMIKGIAEVIPLVADASLYFAKATAQLELRNKIIPILYPELKKEIEG